MNTETKIKHKRYDEAFKKSAVEHWLISGKSARQVAAELGFNVQNLPKWKAGWEFNQTFDYPGYYGPDSGNTPLYFPDSPANAEVIAPSQLVTQPFFKKSPADLFSSNATTAQNYAQQHYYDMLSRAIPARTFGIGANPIGNNVSGFVLSTDMQFLQTGWWSTSREDRFWRHSDCQDMAYIFTHRLFERIVNLGELK